VELHSLRHMQIIRLRRWKGAQFEISIDGMPRTYRDLKPLAIEAAEFLKRKHPHSAVRREGLARAERRSRLNTNQADARYRENQDSNAVIPKCHPHYAA
jgi:hypothetical protein